MVVLTKQEFEEWQSNPTTRKIQAILKAYVQDQRNSLSRNVGRLDKTEKQMVEFFSFLNGIEVAMEVDNLLDFDEGDKE
jgi:hypothetical protein